MYTSVFPPLLMDGNIVWGNVFAINIKNLEYSNLLPNKVNNNNLSNILELCLF